MSEIMDDVPRVPWKPWIADWSEKADFTHAFVAIDGSERGAAYQDIAIVSAGAISVRYAPDLRNNGIDVFDARFERIRVPGDFADPAPPTGFAPFGTEVNDGRVFPPRLRSPHEHPVVRTPLYRGARDGHPGRAPHGRPAIEFTLH